MQLTPRRGRHLSAFLVLILSLFTTSTTAQLINGQYFTAGLAIIDAPAPNSQQNAGGTMAIAIDVSGDGRIQSLQNTQFDSLDIYLVSSQVDVNVTVSEGSGLLDGEQGSTVKHLNFPIPQCLPAANYNLTFYETSVFEGQNIFVITAIPIIIHSGAPNNQDANFACINPPPTIPESQPQPDIPLPSSPFTPSGSGGGSTLTFPPVNPSAPTPPQTPPSPSESGSNAPSTITTNGVQPSLTPAPSSPAMMTYPATEAPQPGQTITASPGFIVPVSSAEHTSWSSNRFSLLGHFLFCFALLALF